MSNQYCSYCNHLLKLLDCCPTMPVQQIFQEQGASSFTDVQFSFTIFMVMISLVPWIFCIVVLINFLIQRNSRTFIRLVTHVIAHIFCDSVKILIFREPRPDGACDTKFGMPSCHSIFAGLYATWTLLELFVYPKFKLSIVTTLEIFMMALIPYSRIYLNYHTLKQVLTGWIIGLIYSIIGWTINYLRQRHETKNKDQ